MTLLGFLMQMKMLGNLHDTTIGACMSVVWSLILVAFWIMGIAAMVRYLDERIILGSVVLGLVLGTIMLGCFITASVKVMTQSWRNAPRDRAAGIGDQNAECHMTEE